MEVTRRYRSRFTGPVVQQAYNAFLAKAGRLRNIVKVQTRTVTIGRDSITFDTLAEFLNELPRADEFTLSYLGGGTRFMVSFHAPASTSVSVELGRKSDIESVLRVFDDNQSQECEECQESSSKAIGNLSKSKQYYLTKFPAEVIREAREVFLSHLPGSEVFVQPITMSISLGDETWSYDDLDEFAAGLAESDSYTLYERCQYYHFTIWHYASHHTQVDVQLPTRGDIQAVFEVLDRNVEKSKVCPQKETVRVFIGHGRNSQWRDLRDHLRDMHDIEVDAYEIGPRAGQSVKEVLQGMLSRSSFALLVLTGEDLHADGEAHARENVIHELGLFQGKLGFTRAIVLLEDEVSQFSNILGINQIRFSKGNIRETFGDVLATIRRELD